MKLTLNRREVKEGLLFKKTVYYLDVNLEVTPEEMSIIKKHKWDKPTLFGGIFNDPRGLHLGWITFQEVVAGRPWKRGFDSIETLARVEREIIENVRIIKANLVAVAGWGTSGPQEIEL